MRCGVWGVGLMGGVGGRVGGEMWGGVQGAGCRVWGVGCGVWGMGHLWRVEQTSGEREGAGLDCLASGGSACEEDLMRIPCWIAACRPHTICASGELLLSSLTLLIQVLEGCSCLELSEHMLGVISVTDC